MGFPRPPLFSAGTGSRRGGAFAGDRDRSGRSPLPNPLPAGHIVLHMQPLTKALRSPAWTEIAIPKAMYMEDVHYRRKVASSLRARQTTSTSSFALTGSTSTTTCHEIADRFRWLPHSVNPSFPRLRLPKEIDLLMMGQVVPMYYPVRQAMLERFRNRKGFRLPRSPRLCGHRRRRPPVLRRRTLRPRDQPLQDLSTCGSRWQVPLAKYFEAPACRSLLLAPGGPDLAALGFRDGETYVECTQDDFEEKALELLERPRHEGAHHSKRSRDGDGAPHDPRPCPGVSRRRGEVCLMERQASMRILYVGWVGYGNLGDDLCRDLFIHHVRESSIPGGSKPNPHGVAPGNFKGSAP